MKRPCKQRTHHFWLYKGMKVVSVPVLVFLILCLATPLILLTSFYLSFSVSKHHNLLLSTYEFIVVAKSNRMAVFFMFNVIIITIAHGSFRPYTKLQDLEWYEVKKDASIEKEALIYCDYYCSDCEDGNDYGSDGYDEDNDDDGSEDDINSEEFYGEEKENGDLERRTEDFIAKVTRKWREELVYEKLMYLAAAATDSSQSSSSM